MNFTKGDPTLLSFEDSLTLFHAMGHGLLLLSNVTYPTVNKKKKKKKRKKKKKNSVTSV